VKLSSVFSAALLFALTLRVLGQDYPKMEVFAGYSHISNTTILDQSLDSNGGIGSIAFNAKPWLGGVGEFGVYHSSLSRPAGATSTNVTFLFGPKFSAHPNARVTPFAQALFGGMHLGNIQFGAEGVSNNAFAMAFGGGLDVKLNQVIALRVVQVDWLRTHFHGNSTLANWQNAPRISVGVVFRLNTE
jgi:hypothetical protein